jgi:hypothetical protein
MATGNGKVVGVGRNVVAQKKNGEIVPVHLSLTEQQIGVDRRYFTGVMRSVEEELEQKKTVLQQERELMDDLAVPAMITDDAGTLHTHARAHITLLNQLGQLTLHSIPCMQARFMDSTLPLRVCWASR